MFISKSIPFVYMSSEINKDPNLDYILGTFLDEDLIPENVEINEGWYILDVEDKSISMYVGEKKLSGIIYKKGIPIHDVYHITKEKKVEEYIYSQFTFHGKTKKTVKKLVKLSQMTPSEIKDLGAQILLDPHENFSFINHPEKYIAPNLSYSRHKSLSELPNKIRRLSKRLLNKLNSNNCEHTNDHFRKKSKKDQLNIYLYCPNCGDSEFAYSKMKPY